jgi:hypothetical protein
MFIDGDILSSIHSIGTSCILYCSFIMCAKLVLGEAGSVVGTTIGLFIFTSICAALIGCLVSILFTRLYVLKDGVGKSVYPEVRIGCSLDRYEDPQSFLTQQADGSVVCFDNRGSGNNTIFVMDDINGYFQKSAAAAGPAKLSLAESLYQVRHCICFCFHTVAIIKDEEKVLNPFQNLFVQLIGASMVGLFTGEVRSKSFRICSCIFTV